MKFSKLGSYIEEANITIAKLARMTGLSGPGISGFIENGNCKVGDLEKISRALGLPMAYWWEEEDAQLLKEKSPDYWLKKENEKLKDQYIARLEKDIERLEKDVARLEEENFQLKAVSEHCEPRKKAVLLRILR